MARGTDSNPKNRFASCDRVAPIDWDDIDPNERPSPKTIFLIDHSRSAIAHNNSPDVGFEFSINAYRGCEHGCVYCYARSTHEYLSMSSGIDFETKILVKEDIASLLRKELSAKSWKPSVINMSGVTDCYQPIERKLELTRSILKVLREFKNPVTIISKNRLVTRDIDILGEMAKYNGVAVFVSVTTLDTDLANKMEPRTSRPQARLEAIRELSSAGIPVGALIAPCIVGLTDHEMPKILEAVAEAGATMASYTALRLPYAVKDLFVEWLEKNYPLKKSRVLTRIESIRDGKLNESKFGSRMRGEGIYANQLSQMFKIFSKKFGLNKTSLRLSTEHFRVPKSQLELF